VPEHRRIECEQQTAYEKVLEKVVNMRSGSGRRANRKEAVHARQLLEGREPTTERHHQSGMYGLRISEPGISGKIIGQQAKRILEVAWYGFRTRKWVPADYLDRYVLVPEVQLDNGIVLVNMGSIWKHDFAVGPRPGNPKQAMGIVGKLEDAQAGSKGSVRFQDGLVKQRLQVVTRPKPWAWPNNLGRAGSCGEPLRGGHDLLLKNIEKESSVPKDSLGGLHRRAEFRTATSWTTRQTKSTLLLYLMKSISR
jgi:hypothetical protein